MKRINKVVIPLAGIGIRMLSVIKLIHFFGFGFGSPIVEKLIKLDLIAFAKTFKSSKEFVYE